MCILELIATMHEINNLFESVLPDAFVQFDIFLIHNFILFVYSKKLIIYIQTQYQRNYCYAILTYQSDCKHNVIDCAKQNSSFFILLLIILTQKQS